MAMNHEDRAFSVALLKAAHGMSRAGKWDEFTIWARELASMVNGVDRMTRAGANLLEIAQRGRPYVVAVTSNVSTTGSQLSIGVAEMRRR